MSSTELTLPDLKRAPCLVLGGGPSMSKFSESDLPPWYRIGVNFCAPWEPDICFVFDLKAIRLLTGWSEIPKESIPPWWDVKPGTKFARVWQTMPALKVTWQELEADIEKTTDNETDWIYMLKLSERGKNGYPPWSKEMERLNCSSNSGLPALNLADLCNAGPIFMLGFDMQAADEESMVHNWHNAYPVSWSGGPNPDKYHYFRLAFRKVVPDEVKARTTVVGPSRLDECGFRVITRDEFMERVHAHSTTA